MMDGSARGRYSPARRAVLLALLAGVLSPSFRADAQQLPFTLYTADDGLAGTQVWDVRQDRSGYLWAATTWGLARFDGERFSSLSVPEGLPSANVRNVLEDGRGRLWIGTNGGLALYDGRRVEVVADLGGLSPSPVWVSRADGAGRLWFGTERGLLLHDGRRMRAFTRDDGLADDYVYSLWPAADGSLWVGSRGAGVTRCELDGDGGLAACRVYDERDGLGHGVVRSITEDRRGRILLATRGGGLAIWDQGSFRRLTHADGLPGDDLYALLVRPNNQLVIGSSDSGLAVCQLPSLRRCLSWREPSGLPDDQVRALFEDREGTLWVGTEGGLARLSRSDLWSYGTAEGLPGRHAYALAADPRGGMWIGTVGGLARLDLGPHGEPAVASWDRRQGLPGNWVWALAAEANGALWVGTEQGLCRLPPARGTCERFGREDGLTASYVLDLLLDGGGTLWVATTDGLARSRPGPAGGRTRFEMYRESDGLANRRSYALAEDRDGRLWVAHNEGLSWRDGDRFAGWTSRQEPAVAAARSLARTRDGELWVGGFGFIARLAGFEAGAPRFDRFSVDGELGGALVLAIADGGEGRLLLGTNRGVLLFDPLGRGGRGDLLARFDRSSGTIATEVAHSRAFARDLAGRAWFGFKGGVTVFPPDLAVPAAASPQVTFERVETSSGQVYRAPFSAVDRGGRSRWLGSDPVALVPGERSLRVSVRALTFRRESGVRFQFRLAGLDRDWSESAALPVRDFTNLDPGRYRLEARAALGDAPWGAASALAIEVRPKLWQTAPVRLLGALTAGALIALAVLARTRRMELRAAELEREVGERTDDLARYARALAEHLAALDQGAARVRDADRARRELLASLSHEVRTPLTSILGFSELLESSVASKMTARELRYLANVRESGNHLLRLVNNLLDQAKLEAGRMEVHNEPVDLAAVLGSIVSLMEGFALTRDVRIEIRVESAPPEVEVDVAKLRQILINLLSNAIKFSPAGAAVTVGARALGAADSRLGEEGYEIEVADRGPGIRAEELATIFQPYRQAGSGAPVQPGTGLGLPIVRQLVQLLGGWVEVESPPGQGSRFRVVLPRVAHRGELVAPEPGDRGVADRPRVLVIEPDRTRFGDLAEALEPADFLAVRAPDVEEARRMLPELRPIALAFAFDPSRAEAWGELARLERDLERGHLPLALVARAGAGSRGWALLFDRVLPAGSEEPEVRAALAQLGSAAAEAFVPGGAPAPGLAEVARNQMGEEAVPWLLVLPGEIPAARRLRWSAEVEAAPPRVGEALCALLRRAEHRRGPGAAKHGGSD